MELNLDKIQEDHYAGITHVFEHESMKCEQCENPMLKGSHTCGKEKPEYGKYTGFKDMMDTPIHEGDVLLYPPKEHKWIVIWNAAKGQWRMKRDGIEMALWDNVSRHRVVGSIHDNF